MPVQVRRCLGGLNGVYGQKKGGVDAFLHPPQPDAGALPTAAAASYHCAASTAAPHDGTTAAAAAHDRASTAAHDAAAAAAAPNHHSSSLQLHVPHSPLHHRLLRLHVGPHRQPVGQDVRVFY